MPPFTYTTIGANVYYHECGKSPESGTLVATCYGYQMAEVIAKLLAQVSHIDRDYLLASNVCVTTFIPETSVVEM